MPPELSELQERTAGADGTPRREAIRGRLAAHLALYRLSRYRPPRTPTTPSRPARRDPAETPEHDGAGPAQLAPRSDHGPSAPASADATEIDLPDVVWVSAGDGTRAPDDLEDSGSSPTSAIVLNQRAARRRQSDDLIALLIDEPRADGRENPGLVGNRSLGSTRRAVLLRRGEASSWHSRT